MSDVKRSATDINRSAVALFVLIAAPIILILCFLTPPFQVADEPSHFLRAIAVSHGEFLPILPPTRDSAGGFVESGAAALAVTFGDRKKVDTNLAHRFAVDELIKGYDKYKSKDLIYAQFSNTAIYFPAAHVVQGLTVFAARALNLKPLGWLYAGRLVNSGLFLLISCIAIKMLRGFEVFTVNFLLVPMTLFEAASMSADQLIIAFSLLFCALIKRLLDGKALGPWSYLAYSLCFIYIGLGKFAYIPLCLLPLAIAVVIRRQKQDQIGLALLALATIVAWLSWTLLIRNDIFDMRDGGGVADPHGQIALILHRPLDLVRTLVYSIRFDRQYLLQTMVGSRLGWLDAVVPIWAVNLSLILLFLSAVVRTEPFAGSLKTFVVIAGCVITCVILIYVLLDIQFTPVGRRHIEGIQGRYFLPMVALVPVTVGGLVVSVRRAALSMYGFSLAALAPILAALWTVLHRYWLP